MVGPVDLLRVHTGLYEMQPKILIDFSEHHLNRSLIEKKLLLYIATVPPRIVSYARTHLMPTSR